MSSVHWMKRKARSGWAATSFEGVTCGFALRNVVSLQDLFAEVARVVVMDGLGEDTTATLGLAVAHEGEAGLGTVVA